MDLNIPIDLMDHNIQMQALFSELRQMAETQTAMAIKIQDTINAAFKKHIEIYSGEFRIHNI